MLRKNNRSGTERKLSVLSSPVVLGVVGCIVFGIGLLPVGAADSARTESEIIINQGLGLGLDGESGELYPMDMLVANRNTGFFVRIEPEEWQEVGGQPTLLISDETDIWRFTDSEYWEEYGLLRFDTGEQKAWEAGQYEVRVDLKRGVTLQREAVFNPLRDIEILIVPIEGYYSGETSQAETPGEYLWEYTEKVYPVGDDDLQWIIYDGEDMDLDNNRYDLDTSLGRLRVWQYLKKLYNCGSVDMVIGIVPENMKQRAASEEATVTGFTFGDGVSVISMQDTCPQVTVAHEIGHCLSLGDEYENGTFSVSMNMVPYGMKGKNRYSLSETVQGTSPYIVGGTADEWQGSGTVVYACQYPYDIFSEEILFRDKTSFMGLSGFPEQEYWVTSQIWESLYTKFHSSEPSRSDL